MKRMVLALCLVGALAITAGCGGKANDSTGGNKGASNAPAGQDKGSTLPDGSVNFEVLAEAQWPAEVKVWVQQVTNGKSQALSDHKTFGDKTYLLVFAGERSSGGYQVLFDKVEAKGGKLAVTARVTPPAGMSTMAITYPVGVARIAKFDGEMTIEVTAAQTSAAPGPVALKAVFLGNVQLDVNQMNQLQKAVDGGSRPGLLDPYQVAIEQGTSLYGFDAKAGDTFKLVQKVEKGPGSGTGEASVEATHEGKVYVIQLIQPGGPGATKIWTVNSIRVKS